MRFDAYTKGVLTVIAIALCVLAIQNAALQSKAQDVHLQKVQIRDDNNCLNLSPVRQRTSAGVRFFDLDAPCLCSRRSVKDVKPQACPP
jgi:hypothetical protein